MFTAARRFFKVFLIAALAILFTMFAISNRDTVHLSLFPLPYGADMPQFLFAILCFAVGALIGWLGASFKLSKSHRQFKTEHKKVMALEHEIEALQSEKMTRFPQVASKM